MKRSEWFGRLQAAIDDALERGVVRSKRALSVSAGLGPNYVSQMLKDDKGPSAEAVVRLASELNVSLTWVFLGVEMDEATEQILSVTAPMTPEQKQAYVGLLRTMSGRSEGQQAPPASDRA